MKAKVLFAAILLNLMVLDLWAGEDLEIVFPDSGKTEISVMPIIKLRAPYPIDMPTFNARFPHNPDSLYLDSLGFFSLMSETTYSVYSSQYADSIMYMISEKCHARIVDSTDIEIYVERPLIFDESYTLMISDRIKMLKPDSTKLHGIDTVNSNSAVIRNFFRTEALLYPKDISIDMLNPILRCDESITITLSKKFDFPETTLEEIFSVVKAGNAIEDTLTNRHTFELDTIACNISLGTDSVTITIDPGTNLASGDYFLEFDFGRVTGYENTKEDVKFNVLDQAIYKVSTISSDESFPLPVDCMEYNGWGDRVISSGDTAYFVVPPFTDDLAFSRWKIDKTLDFVSIDGNVLTITPECDDLKYLHKREIVAIYAPIPIDTLVVIPTRLWDDVSDRWLTDTCSKVTVGNYHDSLGTNLYTYKRISTQPLNISFVPCDDTFEYWDTDLDYDIDTTEQVMSIVRDDFEQGMINQGMQIREIQGVGTVWVQIPCQAQNYRVVVRKDYSPDDGVNPWEIFDDLKLGGQEIELQEVGDEGIYDEDLPELEYLLTGTINDPRYYISYIYVNYPHQVRGTKLKFDNDMNDWVGTDLNETLRTGAYHGCQCQISIYVRRKVYPVEIELTNNDVKLVPSWNIFSAKLDPEPPRTINREFYNLWKHGLGIVSMNSNQYSFPVRSYQTDSDGHSFVDKSTVTFYYYDGDIVDIQPDIFAGSGYTFYGWNDDQRYYDPLNIIDPVNNINRVTVDKPIKGNIICSNGFMLEKIAVHKRRGEAGEIQWEFYTLDPLNIQDDLPLFDNELNFDKGIGLLKNMDFPGRPEHIRALHKYVPQIRFYFTEEPLIATFNGALDVVEDLPGSGNIRHDGNEFTTYPFDFDPDEGNAELIGDGKCVELTLVTGSGEDEQWMCHIQPFDIRILNYNNGSLGRIQSAETSEYLSNLTTSQPSVPITSGGVTCLPGLFVQSKSFYNLRDDDDGFLRGTPDVIVYGLGYVTNKNHAPVLDPGNNLEEDDEGRLIMKKDGIKFPSWRIDYDLEPGHSFSENIEFDREFRILQGSLYDYYFHFVDNNDTEATWNIIEAFLDNMISAGFDLYEAASDKEIDDKWRIALPNLIDPIKELCLNGDRQMGYIAFRLEHKDRGIMTGNRHVIDYDENGNVFVKELEYDLWGVGDTGLYTERILWNYDISVVYFDNGNKVGFMPCPRLKVWIKVGLGDVSDVLGE